MATVYIGSDHAGLALKAALVARLTEKGHVVADLGPATAESCDYPVYAKLVCAKVLAGQTDAGSDPQCFGVLICGTGIGMSMTANHIPGIRAALCGCEFQARATRQHNNANVLCLGERVTGQGVALDMAELFLSTPFEGGRHLRRVTMIETQ
ncbi:MAG: ribose 5-phosphate isomerase B [Bilophila sp.]